VNHSAKKNLSSRGFSNLRGGLRHGRDDRVRLGLEVVGDQVRGAPQRHLTNRPGRVVRQVRRQHADPELALDGGQGDAVRYAPEPDYLNKTLFRN
jgi:hypothetical protein